MLSSAEQDMWSERYKEPLKLLQHLRRKIMRNLESLWWKVTILLGNTTLTVVSAVHVVLGRLYF